MRECGRNFKNMWHMVGLGAGGPDLDRAGKCHDHPAAEQGAVEAVSISEGKLAGRVPPPFIQIWQGMSLVSCCTREGAGMHWACTSVIPYGTKAWASKSTVHEHVLGKCWNW